MATPTMRVAVRDFLFFNQRAQFIQFLHHFGVGFKNVHSFKNAGIFGIATLFVHRAENVQAPLFTGAEIVLPVAGRDMHNTHPGIHGHKVRPDDGVFLTGKRVFVGEPHQFGTGHFAGLGHFQPGIFYKFFG